MSLSMAQIGSLYSLKCSLLGLHSPFGLVKCKIQTCNISRGGETPLNLRH